MDQITYVIICSIVKADQQKIALSIFFKILNWTIQPSFILSINQINSFIDVFM